MHCGKPQGCLVHVCPQAEPDVRLRVGSHPLLKWCENALQPPVTCCSTSKFTADATTSHAAGQEYGSCILLQGVSGQCLCGRTGRSFTQCRLRLLMITARSSTIVQVSTLRHVSVAQQMQHLPGNAAEEGHVPCKGCVS